MEPRKETKVEAQERLKDIKAELKRAFPERGPVIKGVLTALLAGEHALMLGPPGTAKSLFARTFAEAVAGGSLFEILLTKFSTLEDLFGPVSFKGLKEDRYERVLDGKACSKQVWFVDEIFKSSAAILNAMLTAMQERVFHNGSGPMDIPLETVLAASNEYPQDESLAALYDRFSVRFWVDYLGDKDALAGLLMRGGIHPVTTKFKEGDLDALRQAVEDVKFEDGDVQTLLKIKEAIEAEGFIASDRTWVKSTRMVKARAVLAGRDRVHTNDFMVLVDMLWKEHKDRTKLLELVGNAADPYGARAEAIIDTVKAAMNSLPTMEMLKSGQKAKTKMITITSCISGSVSAERDKLFDAEEEAGEGNPAIDEAKETVDAAMKAIDELHRSVVTFRAPKKVAS